ncbi:MAG: EamA family transporter [Planctomycetota bacterium]
MWIVYALSAAVSSAVSRSFIKQAGQTASSRSIVFCRSFFGAVLAWILLLAVGVPSVESGFFLSVLAACVFDVTAILCMSRALRSGDMARSVPLLSFTPVFLLLTGQLIVGETPGLQGVLGVAVIVTGSYFLNLRPRRRSMLEPIKLLLSSNSARLMLLCALLFAFTGPFFKQAIHRSDPFFTMAMSLSISTLMMTLIQWGTGGSIMKILPDASSWKPLLGVGITVFFVALCVNLALEAGLVSYVISLKRLSILMNIAIGALFFDEEDLLQNLFAGSIMVAGAALITLS